MVRIARRRQSSTRKLGIGGMISFNYQEIVKVAPIPARLEIIRVLEEDAFGNISLAARMCGVSRATIRKFYRRYLTEGKEGLLDRSRRPKCPARQTPAEIEAEVIKIFDQTSYGFRRIARELNKRGIKISYGGVRKILKRHNKTRPRKITTVTKTGRRYYNPLDYQPFEFIQVDTKEIIDGKTLPREVYSHFLDLQRRGLPMYQFTALDVRTRISFIAYGQEQSFSNGWAFLVFVVLWLRAFGIKHRIQLQTDWGEEYGGKSSRKIARMNKLLAPLGAEVTRIEKGKKEQNGYVERKHRTDDEELYIPYGEKITDDKTLFEVAYSWTNYYNTKRPHYGRELDGRTPLEYAQIVMTTLNPDIALFPPIFLDKLSCSIHWKGGNDVCKHYIHCDGRRMEEGRCKMVLIGYGLR